MWKCPGCGEEVNDQLEVCWNCQRQKDNLPLPSDTAVEPVTDPEDRFREHERGDGMLEVEVSGKKLVCSVCENATFRERDTLLNTAGLTFFRLDWANKSATTYICSRCGYIFWFLPPS